jgi:hypothetical protein
MSDDESVEVVGNGLLDGVSSFRVAGRESLGCGISFQRIGYHGKKCTIASEGDKQVGWTWRLALNLELKGAHPVDHRMDKTTFSLRDSSIDGRVA